MTSEQRDALALAIQSAYYEEPREATLEDLANEPGISRSGVSQHLKAVEWKLIYERAREFDPTAD